MYKTCVMTVGHGLGSGRDGGAWGECAISLGEVVCFEVGLEEREAVYVMCQDSHHFLLNRIPINNKTI
ncbi:hypothetical protein GJAV_G00218800 [Gymnothorax javanicus]|nr:hypothetical protein GJAV_G00218800 [Gymnothorax javanicus]